MDRIKHKKTIAILAVLAAVIMEFAMLYTSFAENAAETIISEANNNGKLGDQQSTSYHDYIGQPTNNTFSSWDLSVSDAFEVPMQYATRLHSYYDTNGEYPATKVQASGDVGETVHCVLNKGDEYYLHKETGTIFNLSKGDGIDMVYKNLYIYDPKDSGALTKGKAGYVPVDLTVTINYFTTHPYDAGGSDHTYTSDPLIQFSNTVNGLPSINMYNVGDVNVKYT